MSKPSSMPVCSRHLGERLGKGTMREKGRDRAELDLWQGDVASHESGGFRLPCKAGGVAGGMPEKRPTSGEGRNILAEADAWRPAELISRGTNEVLSSPDMFVCQRIGRHGSPRAAKKRL